MRDRPNVYSTERVYEMLDESVLKVVKFYDDTGNGSGNGNAAEMLKSKLTSGVCRRTNKVKATFFRVPTHAGRHDISLTNISLVCFWKLAHKV